MKKYSCIFCLLFLLPVMMIAQSSKNLTSYRIGKLTENSINTIIVNPGEFKVDYDSKIVDQNNYTKTYRYFVISRNEKGDILQVTMNNHLIDFAGKDYPIELLRAGYTTPDYVYIEKRNMYKTQKYYLHANGLLHGPYDKIEDIFPDGLIYKNQDMYLYKDFEYNEASNNICVLEKEDYKENTVKCMINDKFFEFVPKDEVLYYKDFSGHYYMLYNDDSMDNTLLVVDGIGYELDGSIDNHMFRFSHDGKHWAMSGQNYILVDGIIMSRVSGMIKDITINNRGQYSYIIQGDGFNDILYYNNDILIRGIEVLNLRFDNQERLNYICRSNIGYFYGIDYDIIDLNNNMKDYYYPSLYDTNQTFTVKSKNGDHTLVYSYDKMYVLIDGVRVDCQSYPHYATWDQKDNCFIWNSVVGINLMIYKYKVK